MPQNPNQVYPGVYNGVAKPQTMDAQGIQVIANGSSASLNITAAAVIKATPGRAARIIILSPGSTSGAFTFNNCATVGAATTANQIFTLPYNGTNNIAGAVFHIDVPCTTGIVCSAVPGAGSPRVIVTYT
jgi:hypothetical protein